MYWVNPRNQLNMQIYELGVNAWVPTHDLKKLPWSPTDLVLTEEKNPTQSKLTVLEITFIIQMKRSHQELLQNHIHGNCEEEEDDGKAIDDVIGEDEAVIEVIDGDEAVDEFVVGDEVVPKACAVEIEVEDPANQSASSSPTVNGVVHFVLPLPSCRRSIHLT
ncbi:hypothetical protein C1H46_011463 [Malus baccata]|uniref:Uncharacterized protein n=1 Tax=Malus baccata TaxID=106549 RepID=A0A540MVS5_MALBA|nr:hypothetical protein C1H46_011463 [Malus baccata]